MLDFDVLDPAIVDDPYPAYARLRREAPVLHLPAYDVWLVTRHRDVRQVVADSAAFSSRLGMSPDVPGVAALRTGVDYRIGAPNVRVLIALDPPEHRVFRRAVSAAFAPSAVDSLRDRIRQLARQRVAELVHRSADGDADFFRDVAAPLPVSVLATVLGVPADLQQEFRAWSGLVTAELDQGAAGHPVGRGLDMFRYFARELRRRRAGGAGTDLLGVLAGSRPDGITDGELLAFCAFLLVAGIETTTSLLTNLMAALLRFPGEQHRLWSDRELAAAAVEEGIRYDAPVQALWRGTTGPVELGGHALPAGARVLAVFGSANRDEEVFADPDRFRLDRPAGAHLGFGGGAHFCLGARLARAEVTAVLTELAAVVRRIEPAGPVERTRSVVLRGLTRQPVAVTA